MKFHHQQKVNINKGYYNTFKGYIQEHRTDKNNKVEYSVKIKFKNIEEPLTVWIPEENLSKAWF